MQTNYRAKGKGNFRTSGYIIKPKSYIIHGFDMAV